MNSRSGNLGKKSRRFNERQSHFWPEWASWCLKPVYSANYCATGLSDHPGYWNDLGRLRERIDYTPSGDPDWFWVVSATTEYIYDGLRIIQARDGSNTPTVSYTRGTDLSGTLEGAGGIGGLLARSDVYSGGTWNRHFYYHADGNGNITYLSVAGGNVRYDPYGNTLSGTVHEFGFSSKLLLPGGGYYFGYRIYSPSLQRWLNRDRIGELGGINLYELVGNNPVNNVDPLGLLTAVFIGGPSSLPGQLPNPFGHAAIAFSGQGVYSFGTSDQLGSSFTGFLNNQATYRGGTVYIMNTTPQQEQAMIDHLKGEAGKPLQKYPDNCANLTASALSAGGINLSQTVPAAPSVAIPTEAPINPSFPADIAASLGLNPDVLQISIPGGTTLPPNFLTGFNPKQ